MAPSRPAVNGCGYLFHLASNHGFVDGNKRTAAQAALIFLELNGVETNYPLEDAEAITLGVAAGQATKEEVIAFFRSLLARD